MCFNGDDVASTTEYPAVRSSRSTSLAPGNGTTSLSNRS